MKVFLIVYILACFIVAIVSMNIIGKRMGYYFPMALYLSSMTMGFMCSTLMWIWD